MTIVEYILILLSMILGLAVTHLASGVGELLRSRKVVTWALPYVLWLAFCFLSILDLWTTGWLLRNAPRWTLMSISLLLAGALAVYLAVLWMIPRHIGNEPIDLGDFMMRERRYFLGALLGYCAIGLIVNLYLFPDGHFDWANYYVAGPLILGLSAAWWSPRRWVQIIAASIGLALFALYYTVYFPSIG